MEAKEFELLRKEREHQEDLQRLRGLRPIDDDFMRCLFKDDIEFTQHILRILINNHELSIVSIDTILMHDFRCSDPNEMLDEHMAYKTRFYKETEKGVEQVCKVMEEMRAETRLNDYVDMVRKLMKNLNLTVDSALDTLEIPADERDIVISRLNM